MSYKLYDAEIEYLKTLGNADCYIDIPMVHNSFFKKEFEFKREDSGGSYDVVVASYTEVSFVFWNSLSRYVANLSGKEFNLYVYGSEGKKVKVIAKQPKVSLIVDGRTTEQTFGIEQSKTSNIFRLFSSVKNRHGVISIYYFKAWDESDNLVLDLIPVRVGNVGYMFDRVSGQLFGNSGTGSFVLGPDVAPGRKANEVAFLESWGNQYIDTGIKPSTDTKIELKCLYCKSGAGLTSYGSLIGADDRNNAYILNHSAVANFTYGLEFSNNFANPQTRLLTFDSTASPQNMRVYDEGGSLVTTLTCLRGVFEVNQNLYLFATNRSGTPVYGSNRILYCKIYDGDTLVRDYVPVEYNGIGYMYDKVSGLFFDNQGTGKFLFGSITKACARSYTRRQLMMYKEPPPYIQDGLVLWLDGINKGGNANAWTDLIRKVEFPYNEHSTVNADSVSFDGGEGSYLKSSDNVVVNVPYQTGTIEVVAEQGTYYGAIFGTGINGSICFIRKSNGITTGTSINNSRKRITKNIPNTAYTVSVSVDNFFVINGVAQTYSTANEWVNSSINFMYVGGSPRMTCTPCKIYCVRIYNRVLTMDEVLKNQKDDNIRFNLGLDI